MIELGSDVHAFGNGEEERETGRREKEVVSLIGEKLGSHPDSQAAAMLHEHMVFGDLVVLSRELLGNSLPRLIQSLHVSIPINSTDIFANDIQVCGMSPNP